MDIKVRINTVIITDRATGMSYKVKTVRSAKEIAGYVEESEKEEAAWKLQELVSEALG